jgi:hypothetical protein
MKKTIITFSLFLSVLFISSCGGGKFFNTEALIPVQGVWSGTDSLNRHVTFLFNKDSSVAVEIKQNANSTMILNRYVGTYKVYSFTSGLAKDQNYNSITGTIVVNRISKEFSFISYSVFVKDIEKNLNTAQMQGNYNTNISIPVTLKNIYPYYLNTEI